MRLPCRRVEVSTEACPSGGSVGATPLPAPAKPVTKMTPEELARRE